MGKNGYVNFNFLDSKPNINNILVTLFQTTPSCVVAEPNQIAVCIGHLSWDADFGRSGSSGFVGRFRRLR